MKFKVPMILALMLVSLSAPCSFAQPVTGKSLHFENDILPLLARYGCNSSGCHGKAEGQNGFKLSVFGFDPEGDYSTIVKEARGRRLFPAAPDQSLLLTKASGRVPHGGGTRIQFNSPPYRVLRDWIAAGTPIGDPNAPRVERVRVEPTERLLSLHGKQALRVFARYTNGQEVEVTDRSRFQSNNEAIAMVSSDGEVAATDVPGEAAIMVAFANEIAVFRAIIPRPEQVAFPQLAANNFIDPLVDNKLRKLNIVPSGPVEEGVFLRRVYLDIIGTLPTVEETRKYLEDTRPDKRAKLVDALLERPEYADYWALKWADVLRVDRSVLNHKGAYSYYKWIRDGLAANKPYDQFARELIVAEGPLDEVGAGNFYRVVTKPGEMASTLSQVFLGVRIGCAECHHHPYDRWGQDDYYAMTAFFNPVGVRKIGTLDALVTTGESTARQLRTGQMLAAAPLGERRIDIPVSLQMFGAKPIVADTRGDQRDRLAAWMTSPRNPWFARNLANRYWAHFLGRGLIDPVDDFRATNPPTNPELLEHLAQHFVENKFDLKQLIRTITSSRVYQTSSKPTPSNQKDEQNYSRALMRRIDAEVLLDMICQTLGVGEKFEGMPADTRAIQLWDSKVRHYFLKQFGRPVRVSACECERASEPNIAQVLHLLNSELIDGKIRHEDGTVARLLRKYDDNAKLVDELFLMFYCRLPTDQEKTITAEHFRKYPGSRRTATEDLVWTMVNSKEFLFNR
jgi:hypothetical protein